MSGPASQWDSWQRYASGVAIIVLAGILQTGLRGLAGDGVAFMLFHPALVLIAVYCGRGPALLGLLLSAAHAASTLHAFSGADSAAAGRYAVLIYIAVGASIIFIASALRRATQRAHSAEERLRLVQDNVGVGLWEIDVRRQMLLASRSLWRVLRTHGPDTPIPVERWQSSLPPAELTRFRGVLEMHTAAGVRSFEHEFLCPLADGRVHHYLTSVNIEYGDDDSPTFLRAATVDITRLKQLEAEQQRSLQELREVDRRRTEFLAALAHELRNPLAPIRHAALLAQSTRADADQIRWSLDVIDRQVTHMARLLDDLLEASRIARGALELRPEAVELASVVTLATETARPLFDAKHHAFDCRLPTTEVWLQADPVRLAQVFSNLLTNAAKYTPDGGSIRLTAEMTDEHVTVYVRDNGIGIAPEMLPRVFEMFAQAESAHEYAQGGVGVGLALVKGLVQLHGGTVTAYSAGLHRGSEFVVRLPRIAAPGRVLAGTQQSHATAVSRRILIVDDNRDAADSLALLLELDGHDVAVAYDGDTALQACAARTPDIALLDIGMPNIDGYELARRLRAQSWGREIQLVAVTGWGQQADRVRALDAGFDAHLTKPVSAQALASIVARPDAQTAAA